MNGIGASVSAPDGGAWDRETQLGQLEQLNAMERQQDVNLWTANSIYVAASALILVALFTSPPTDMLPMKWMLPVVGFAITSAWLVTSTRAHQYENRWVWKARCLEKVIPIPTEYRVWNRPPSGIPAKYAEYALVYFFAFLWIGLSFVVSGLCVPTVLFVLLVALTVGLGTQPLHNFSQNYR